MKSWKRRYYFWRADVHLLSYPKCGRTWLRLMLAAIIEARFDVKAKNPLQLHKLVSRRRGIPCILASHDWRDRPANMEGIKLERDKSRFAGKRVILLVRDPRDVVVSNYYQKAYRERSFPGTLHEFVHHPVWGIENIVNYYNVWAGQKDIPSRFQLVRYEDMRSSTEEMLVQIIDFIGIDGIDENLVKNVVADFSFENMKRRERASHYDHDTLRAVDATDQRTYKARSGKIGGYREELSPDDQEYVDRVMARDRSNFLNLDGSTSNA